VGAISVGDWGTSAEGASVEAPMGVGCEVSRYLLGKRFGEGKFFDFELKRRVFVQFGCYFYS